MPLQYLFWCVGPDLNGHTHFFISGSRCGSAKAPCARPYVIQRQLTLVDMPLPTCVNNTPRGTMERWFGGSQGGLTPCASSFVRSVGEAGMRSYTSPWPLPRARGSMSRPAATIPACMHVHPRSVLRAPSLAISGLPVHLPEVRVAKADRSNYFEVSEPRRPGHSPRCPLRFSCWAFHISGTGCFWGVRSHRRR